MMKYVLALCGAILFSATFSSAQGFGNGNGKRRNYREAGYVLPKIYTDTLAYDLYCGCHFIDKKNIDNSNCGFRPRHNPRRRSYKRAQRIEWEHIVTAHNMGHFRECWRTGGRKNCTRNDDEFALIEGDLHNLYPAIGEINGDRNNFMYSVWSNQPEPMYGNCATVVDFKLRKVQPRAEIRGLIARVHFYMEKQYGIHLSKQDRQLFEAWDKMYPVTKAECIRDARIKKFQGNSNPFVSKHCPNLPTAK